MRLVEIRRELATNSRFSAVSMIDASGGGDCIPLSVDIVTEQGRALTGYHRVTLVPNRLDSSGWTGAFGLLRRADNVDQVSSLPALTLLLRLL